MQYIIDGGYKETRSQTVASLFPPETTSYFTISKEKTSISVASIREILTNLNVTTSITRVVWIQDAEALTVAAQNTLLKALEEPPARTHFILSLDNYRRLLPTITSRCQLIHLQSSHQEVDAALLQELKVTMSLGPAGRLDAMTKLGKDRQELSAWFLSLLSSLASTLSTTTSTASQKFLVQVIDLARVAHQNLAQNGNPTLVIGHFFLCLPRLKN